MPGKANLARLIVCDYTITVSTVKSGNFGHQVNSDINFQTVESSLDGSSGFSLFA